MASKTPQKSRFIPQATTADRYVPIKEAVTITCRSRSSIIRDVQVGAFPQPVKIGGQRRWVWRMSVLNQWMDDVARTANGGAE